MSCKNSTICTFYIFLLQLANQSAYSDYSAYSSKEYREATTKEEQCKVPIDGWEIGKSGDMEKMKKEYNEYCLKSKSNNIIFCPEEIIKRNKDKKVKWINDYFKKIWYRGRLSVSMFDHCARAFLFITFEQTTRTLFVQDLVGEIRHLNQSQGIEAMMETMTDLNEEENHQYHTQLLFKI